MADRNYPIGTEVQWVESMREIYPYLSTQRLTVVAYNEDSGFYTLRVIDSGLEVSSDRGSIEPYVTAPKDGISREDAITQIIVAHSYPETQFAGSHSSEVKTECRCGVTTINTGIELFQHAMHIAEEIEKVVRKNE